MNNSQSGNLLFNSETIQVELLKIDHENKLLICFSEKHDPKSFIVKYDVDPENSAFTESVKHFWPGAKLNLINCVSDENNFLIPTYIILEPDYLIDASAIAECFQDYSVTPLHFFRNRFEMKENRSYLLLGNLANFFLDELIFTEDIEDVSFNEVFVRSFKYFPFEYTSCEDISSESNFREFIKNAKSLFENIKRVVNYDFLKQNVKVDHCTLEPSFFSAKYGFQGRLDLLNLHPETAEMQIIELKSGKLPYPRYNSSLIALNHKVQTYIYRLLVESVFGEDNYKIDAAILYASSNNSGENLRKANLDGNLEKSIINLRNQIIINEYKIINGDINSVETLFVSMFQQIKLDQKLPSFYINKINKIKSVLIKSKEIERIYFYRYIQFISRELYHQKIGGYDYETPTGIASLWNSEFSERASALDVIYDLSIIDIQDSEKDMTIIFGNNKIVNFREGEICIVYPRKDNYDSVLNKQILKGTIVEITAEKIVVRFRYKQKNRRYFEDNKLWAIEHDTIDYSYTNMYKSLFSFLNASESFKELLLGLKRPVNLTTADPHNNINLSDNIVDQALSAQDYFLLVGPPGTGKTSIYAKRLIEEYYKNPDTNIMVIAYTNRAVDELCEAINAAFNFNKGECNNYLRVGSEYSCAEAYRHRLLQKISENSNDRESLKNEIINTRIFVATLASLAGKMELFSLKKFHVAIIDEASQILEPQIVGILSEFEKFIMIGDHNQLSTIVLQNVENSTIRNTELNEIGILDCRSSLFERLLQRCINMSWTHAYAQLTYQGRMHEDISAFPSKFFYSKSLLSVFGWQNEEWNLKHEPVNNFDEIIATRRTNLFSTENIKMNHESNKINIVEADIILDLVKSISRIYRLNGKNFDHNNIGIIAPYRNQIALIRYKLYLSKVPDADKIMIDTVERFQGSQRDIIIVSFCVNVPEQMKFLCNLNYDKTVDRKLNVALTRARHQLFLVGNAAILKQHPIYGSLVNYYKSNLIII